MQTSSQMNESYEAVIFGESKTCSMISAVKFPDKWLLWMYEWMMHLYSALLCIAVHPKCFTIMWGGGGSLLKTNCFFFFSIVKFFNNSYELILFKESKT